MRSIGAFLREKRIEKGFDEGTFPENSILSQRVLNALEEDDFTFFKGHFYYINFLKDYIRELELDPEEIFSEYRQEIDSIKNNNFTTGIYFPGVRYSRFTKRKTLLKMFVITVLLLFSVLFLFKKGEFFKNIFSGKQGITPGMIPETFRESIVKKPFESDYSPVNMSLLFRGDCWVRILRGKSVVLERVFHENETYQLKGYRLLLYLGNPSAVEIKVNGNPVEKFRNRAGSVKLDLSPDTLERYIK